jgi:carbonic anhydrase/acetyltransferase-like protein (isoleucine patch superfamily)
MPTRNTVRAVLGNSPEIDDSAWLADNVVILGNVKLHAGASIWFNTTLRADLDRIEIGPGSNLQDNVTVHVDAGFPMTLGAGVSVGHAAVLHGCTVEDDCLIGMGAVLLNGSQIGRGSLVAAGTVVLEGTIVPPGSLVAGVPGKVRRPLTEEEQAHIRQNAETYQQLRDAHREAAE